MPRILNKMTLSLSAVKIIHIATHVLICYKHKLHKFSKVYTFKKKKKFPAGLGYFNTDAAGCLFLVCGLKWPMTLIFTPRRWFLPGDSSPDCDIFTPLNAIELDLAVIGWVFNCSWADFFRISGNPDLIDCWCVNYFILYFSFALLKLEPLFWSFEIPDCPYWSQTFCFDHH